MFAPLFLILTPLRRFFFGGRARARLPNLLRNLTALAAAVSMAACASGPKEQLTAEELYQDASEKMAQANFGEAERVFEELKAAHPNSPQAQQAFLDLAYSHYSREEFDKAIEQLDQFIRLYTAHPSVDYAYYLKGLSYFREDRGFLDYLGRQNQYDRDARGLYLAMRNFEIILNNFPRSRYAEDAGRRVRYIINSLARHEIAVADYYQRRGAHLAAVSRVKWAMERFPDSLALEDGLVILANSYAALGMPAARDDALSVLRLNYPDNPLLSPEE